MPKGLLRHQHSGNFHFVTFSCYHRKPLLETHAAYHVFEEELEKVRSQHSIAIIGYVLMPEHVHLLTSEPSIMQLSMTLDVLKQQVSRRVKQPEDTRFWQRRYYDFNIWNHTKTIEKLKYIHRNPVRRGLVSRPEDWPWSSFRHYLTDDRGTVEIESSWTQWHRQINAIQPPQIS